MSVREEIKEQRNKLKGAPFKDKFNYFMEYYKWPTLVCIVVIIMIVCIIHDVIKGSRPDYLYAIHVNSHSIVSPDDLTEEYINFANVDTKNYNLSIDASMFISLNENDTSGLYDQQKIMAMLAAKDIDVMMMDEAVFNLYAYNETFLDLNSCLTKEQIDQYEDLFKTATYEDGTTHIVGINVSNIPYITDYTHAYDYIRNEDEDNNEVFIGIVANTQRIDHALAYIDYLMNYSN